MRVMVMVKATTESEAGLMPSTELLEAMGKYNEELVKAGIMLAGGGVAPVGQGHAGGLRRTEPDRHRRPLRRDQGAGGRLLVVGGQGPGRKPSRG